MKAFVFSFLTLFASCAMLSDNVTPAMEAVAKMKEMHMKTLDVFEGLVDQATATPEEKAKIKAAIAVDREKFGRLSGETLALLQTFGSVDWQKIALDLFDLYKKVEEK